MGKVLQNGHASTKNISEKDKKMKNKVTLKEKEFVPRNSLLTDLFEVKYFKNIYLCFLVVLISLVINHIGHDLIFKGELRLDRLFFLYYFTDIHVALYKCGLNFLINFLTPLGFYVWAFVYQRIRKNGLMRKCWNLLHVIVVFYCFLAALKSSAGYVRENNLQFVGSAILLTEQVRLIMKSYAYIRTNVGKVINHNYNEDKPLKLPSFSKYLYFVFIPTLVYGDVYPRTKQIRWKEVAKYFGEIIGGIFMLCYIFENHFIPICERFRYSTFTFHDVAWEILRSTLTSITLFFLVFYFTLHIWMNLFAELLTFADRLFYEDWWNTTSFTVYYRKWNIVVHDFLYTYFYKDIIENVTPNSKILPKLSVFLISSLFHEYIIYYTLNMFYPVLFILFFGFSVFLTFINSPDNPILNVMFLYGMGVGNSIFFTLNIIEACARKNDCSIGLNANAGFIYSSTFSSNCTRY